MKFFKILLLFVSIILISCSSNSGNRRDHVITIATFNIEWLGDGINDKLHRTSGEYKRLAKVIKETEADIIACQEIENTAALEKLTEFLPEYSCYVEERGPQNVGIIYKTALDLKILGAYSPIAIDSTRNRPGLEIYAKADNFDFSMMIVHLKSTSRYDNTDEKRRAAIETRSLQSKAISDWVNSCLSNKKEQDYIILGDFNDAPKRANTALRNLINNSNLVFLTEDTKSCGRYSDNYSIDNIVVSQSALKRCYRETLHVFDFTTSYTAKQLESMSDHCPVLVQFDISAPDND